MKWGEGKNLAWIFTIIMELKIKNSIPIQNNFLGHNAVYHGYAGLPDDAGRVYSDELCDLEADRAAALGLKIARTFYKWYSYDFNNNCWDWENAPDYVAFCRWVERMQKRGIDIALNAGWCSPGDILSSSWNGKSPFTVEGDWNASVEKYAKWVSDTVHDLVEVRGFTNVKYLVMFTEPQNGRGCPPEAPNSYECWLLATKAAVEQLIKDNRRHLVKIIGPNEGSTTDPIMLKWVKENYPDLVDVYTAHNYVYGLSPIPTEKDRLVANGSTRGMRIQQTVNLKPYTEYEMTVTSMAHLENPQTASGYMLFGAFHPDESSRRGLFSAGGQPTTRISRSSTKMVQASDLFEAPTEYVHRFTTEDVVENIVIGVFFDIIQANNHASVTSVHLKEVKTGEEILKNPDFYGEDNWEDTAFKFVSSSIYSSWVNWINKYKSYLESSDELWCDEYNTIGAGMLCDYDQPRHGTNLAATRLAFMNCGIQSSLMWTLFDQQWPSNHTQQPNHRFYDGDHRFGDMPVLTRSLKPHPAYYAMQITGYAGGGEGTKVYEGIGNGNINLSMTESPDGTVTVLVVNDSNNAIDINIQFEKNLNCDLYRYLYDPEKIVPDENATPISCDKQFKSVECYFEDTLPPYAVVAYTNKIR